VTCLQILPRPERVAPRHQGQQFADQQDRLVFGVWGLGFGVLVILTYDSGELKIADFGLARFVAGASNAHNLKPFSLSHTESSNSTLNHHKGFHSNTSNCITLTHCVTLTHQTVSNTTSKCMALTHQTSSLQHIKRTADKRKDLTPTVITLWYR